MMFVTHYKPKLYAPSPSYATLQRIQTSHGFLAPPAQHQILHKIYIWFERFIYGLKQIVAC